jgi:hypothetical protein
MIQEFGIDFLAAAKYQLQHLVTAGLLNFSQINRNKKKIQRQDSTVFM